MLDRIAAGSRVFLDAPIFIYHFAGSSRACRGLLERCELGEVQGLTNTIVVAEVAHRLMTIEAIGRGLVEPGNVVKKLRRRPRIVRQLSTYSRQVEAIPLMAIDVQSVGLRELLRSAPLRAKYGLLVNDSLIAASALASGASHLATADRDFERLDDDKEGFEVVFPSDLGRADP